MPYSFYFLIIIRVELIVYHFLNLESAIRDMNVLSEAKESIQDLPWRELIKYKTVEVSYGMVRSFINHTPHPIHSDSGATTHY